MGERKEIWKPISGYDGLYEISNRGRVKSLFFKNGTTFIKRDKILTPTDNGNGYLIVPLTKDGVKKNYYVHRLVANAFVQNPKGKRVVNHKDFNKMNNNSENLEWCTQKENVRYSARNMRKAKRSTTSKTGEKYIYTRNGKYRVSIKGKIDKVFPTFEEAVKRRNEVMYGISFPK